MSAFGTPKSPTSTTFSGPQQSPTPDSSLQDVTASSSPQHVAAPARDSPPPRTRTERSSSIRPMSMVQTYQPPLMEIAQDTIPELQPIFSFLNSHANKLYQEGYFLKLNDLDNRTLCASPFQETWMTDLSLQRAGLLRTGPGRNRSLSWSGRSCHYGMHPRWTLPARMERSLLHSSILRMPPLRW